MRLRTSRRLRNGGVDAVSHAFCHRTHTGMLLPSISPGWYFALTFSFCFRRPAFDKVGGPRRLRWLLLLLLDRRFPPSEKTSASCYAWQPCEVAAEELAHLRLIPPVKRDLRFRKLA